MKEHGTIFSGDMPCKILEGIKTHTRRPVKRSNTLVDGRRSSKLFWGELDFDDSIVAEGPGFMGDDVSPYLKVARNWEGGLTRYRLYPMWSVGDRLWVKEAWAVSVAYDSYGKSLTPHVGAVGYRSGGGFNFEEGTERGRWRPSMYMPRSASRILLEVTRVWPERLQDITYEGARAEGVAVPMMKLWPDPFGIGTQYFHHLWDSLYAKKPEYQWAANPWVWTLEFKVIE